MSVLLAQEPDVVHGGQEAPPRQAEGHLIRGWMLRRAGRVGLLSPGGAFLGVLELGTAGRPVLAKRAVAPR